MSKFTVLTALSLLCCTAMAQEPSLDYNEASLSYAAYKSGSTTYNGYAADVGAMFTQNIYGLANYQSVDNGHISQSKLGLGYRMPVGGGADGFFTLKYESDTETATSSGYSLGAGVRAKVTGDMDVVGGYSYRIMGSLHDYTFDAGLNYKFNSNMFGKLGYSNTAGDSSTSAYVLGVGFNF